MKLSSTDVVAILAALPLVLSVSTGDPMRDSVTKAVAVSAAEKLSHHKTNFLSRELTVIGYSVELAQCVLSGEPVPELDTSSIDVEELSKYVLCYDRLSVLFDQLLPDM